MANRALTALPCSMDKSATQLARSHYVSRERHVTVRRLQETSLVNPMPIILAQRHKIRPAISITRIGPGLRYVVTENSCGWLIRQRSGTYTLSLMTRRRLAVSRTDILDSRSCAWSASLFKRHSTDSVRPLQRIHKPTKHLSMTILIRVTIKGYIRDSDIAV